MAAEVVVRVQDEETPHAIATPYAAVNGTNNARTDATPPYPVEEIPAEVIVRAEEILLVVLVLVLWVAAIALFFNRWGKIRMLEPYQPKFQQQHRASCPMGDSVLSPQVSVKSESERLVQRMKHRMSFSKYNVNCMGDAPMYTSLPSPNPLRRPRQNSVFVGSSTMAIMNPPRRVKSAIDIQHMVLSDYSPGSLSGCSSLLPMVTKRPSITIERVPTARHPPSKTLYQRRPSCFTDRPRYFGRHRHFISFDQPTTSWDRRTSVSVERPIVNRNKYGTRSFDRTAPSSFERNVTSFDRRGSSIERAGSSIERAGSSFDRIGTSFDRFGSSLERAGSSLERAGSSLDQPALVIDPPSNDHSDTLASTFIPNSPRSHPGRSCPESMVCLHQPPASIAAVRRPSFQIDAPPSVSPNRHHRLSISLDHSTSSSACQLERRGSDAPSLRSPVSISFDETQIKLSNLVYSKASDV